MKARFSFHSTIILLTVVVMIFSNITFAQVENNSGVNLAVVAEPSGSYVSGDTTLSALNDENEPRNSFILKA